MRVRARVRARVRLRARMRVRVSARVGARADLGAPLRSRCDAGEGSGLLLEERRAWLGLGLELG
jgi:hypothetical protein